jgi:hypothetical protein
VRRLVAAFLAVISARRSRDKSQLEKRRQVGALQIFAFKIYIETMKAVQVAQTGGPEALKDRFAGSDLTVHFHA